MSTRQEKMEAFGRLLDIMDDLREKCPWDRKQTMQTLRNLTIEETYELADAINAADLKGVKEELGDLMLHLIFYSKIGEEQGAFNMAEVLHAQCDKLIHRHPHIYGDVVVADEDEVKRNWEQLKLKEGKKSVLQGVPVSLPALIKAYRIQDKAGQVNFQWENTLQVWEKVQEEIGELKEHLGKDNPLHSDVEDEFGDLLFALVNLSRYIGVDPENSLERTNKKFIRRFTYIEEQAVKSGKTLKDMSLQEMDELWNEAKSME
jgi:XTP/dITP diphosphohydrolase